ncbi:MAG: S41 family peptidase [Verrucomicrobiota bacterium]|nr:S41 family peptidase [Verrucomicrobiota bacterium]
MRFVIKAVFSICITVSVSASYICFAETVPAKKTDLQATISLKKITPPNAKVPNPTTTPTGAAVVQQSEFNEVLQILKSKFSDSTTVTETQISSAALEGILKQLSPSVQILDSTQLSAKSVTLKLPLRTEILPGDIGYMTIPELNDDTIGKLDKTLAAFPENIKGLIIDLRFASGSNYSHTADFAARFLANGQTLFKIRGLKNEDIQVFNTAKSVTPNLDVPLVLVVNSETSGSAEALAAALKEKSRAIIVGNETSGRGASFIDTPLSTGRMLRLTNARLVYPSGFEIFPKGLAPDITVSMDLAEQINLLQKAAETGTTDLVVDKDTRRRLNEAALVRNENPEIENWIERNNREKTGQAPAAKPVKDQSLQRAVDVLKGIQVLNVGLNY